MHKKNIYRKKYAFTLAETLTTLAVIGVIAVLTLPVLNANVNEQALTQQKKTFELKLKQGLRIMQTKGELGVQYETTQDFLKAFEKHIGIHKICANSNLSGCFPEKIMENTKTVKYKTSELQSQNSTGISADFTSDLGGVVFNNGVKAIITYRKDCLIANSFDNNADVTQCFSMIYDVNGDTAPNIIGEDIATINLGQAGALNKKEWDFTIFTPSGYKKEDCEKAKSDGAPIQNCHLENDCWAMAVDTCYKQGKRLPKISEIQEISEQLFGQNISLSPGVSINDVSVSDEELFNKLGNPFNRRSYWTSQESSETHAYAVAISSKSISMTVPSYSSSTRKSASSSDGMAAFCIK